MLGLEVGFIRIPISSSKKVKTTQQQRAMASSLGTVKSTEERKRGRNHGSSSNSLSTSRKIKPSCFYKLIVSPNIQFKKLRIPEVFARAFSDELSRTAVLTVPSGESWEVELVNEDNQLWFCNGWQEFVEYFSLCFAYFLLFLYEGTSKFKVHIFSPTACEIFYPCNAGNSSGGPIHSNPSASSTINDSDIKVITLDSEDEEPPLHGHEEPMSNDNDVTSDTFVGSLSACDDMELDPYKGSLHINEVNDANQETPSDNLWLQSEEVTEALASVGISKPRNPFFVILIKKYNVSKGCFVTIPVYFTRQHLKCKTGETVKLEASNGKQWPVRCVRKRAYLSLGRGWIIFARENSLKVGDVCVFEMTDAKNCVLKFHVGMKSQLTNQDRWIELLKRIKA